MPIFEVVSKVEKKIKLTEVQWSHIRYKHKELDTQLQNMITTLKEPDFVYYSPGEKNYHYYRRFGRTPVTEKYLLLVVKHLNEEGFVITAFFVSKIRRKGKEVVYGKESINKL